ncbi:hypothetical protein PanWU01x14_324350, partial [Parasponia andersonii]
VFIASLSLYLYLSLSIVHLPHCFFQNVFFLSFCAFASVKVRALISFSLSSDDFFGFLRYIFFFSFFQIFLVLHFFVDGFFSLFYLMFQGSLFIALALVG